tara:strand:+ start:4062 stop:4934 length:873 start_codon:yes stop_codon:yes gene_type:complete
MDIWVILNPAIRVVTYAMVLSVVGTFLFSFHFSKYQATQDRDWCSRLLTKMAAIGLMGSAASFFSISGNMGGNFSSAFSLPLLELALSTKAGVASLCGLLGFLLVLCKERIAASLSFRVVFPLASVLLLLTFLVSGHASKLGIVAQTFLFVHLLGVSFWLGALLPIKSMCLTGDSVSLYRLTDYFGKVAVFYVTGLILSGTAFAYLLIGDLSLLVETTYGNVLLGKLLAVSGLLTLGALNKWWCVPKLMSDPSEGILHLKASINYELALAFCILVATSVLTTSLSLPMGG